MNPLLSLFLLAVTPPVSARISQVVVYPDRAQVTRIAEVACGPRAMARFEAIPPAADPASLRAHTSTGTIEGLRAEERTRAEAFAPEVRDLETAIRTLEGEARVVRESDARAEEQARRAAQLANVAVTMVGREMNDPVPNLKAWGQAFEATLAARLRAAAVSVGAAAKLRDLEVRLGDLRRQRARLTASAERREFLAVVLVACPAGQRAEVALSYFVGGAGWSPSYEARADETGAAVDLSAFATVTQATGEDWQHTRVILSTAVPRQNATPPDPARLQVWAEPRDKERKVLVRREELTEHAEASSSAEKDERATPARMGIAAQGLSVQLVVPEAADVAGDGTPVRLFIASTRLAARFAYRAAPRKMPFVFRVAELTNQAPFPLLPGPLDAYRKGGLIARMPLERVAEGARFQLTFGIEEALRVKRIVVEEVQRDTGIFGTNHRFRFGYRFEIGNFGARPETLELTDQVPVSELDDVKVAIDAAAPPGRVKTTPGYEARLDDGLVVWKVALKAGEKRTVELAFHVDVPSSYDSGVP